MTVSDCISVYIYSIITYTNVAGIVRNGAGFPAAAVGDGFGNGGNVIGAPASNQYLPPPSPAGTYVKWSVIIYTLDTYCFGDRQQLYKKQARRRAGDQALQQRVIVIDIYCSYIAL